MDRVVRRDSPEPQTASATGCAAWAARRGASLLTTIPGAPVPLTAPTDGGQTHNALQRVAHWLPLSLLHCKPMVSLYL